MVAEEPAEAARLYSWECSWTDQGPDLAEIPAAAVAESTEPAAVAAVDDLVLTETEPAVVAETDVADMSVAVVAGSYPLIVVADTAGFDSALAAAETDLEQVRVEEPGWE